jgi:hypothetical protein
MTGPKLPRSVPIENDKAPKSFYLERYKENSKRVWFGISPCTIEYHEMMRLAERLGVPWQRIVRTAITTYLTNFPEDFKKF